MDEEVIRRHRGDMLQVAADIRDCSLQPSTILRKLRACLQKSRLYLALGETVRFGRSLLNLDWVENRSLSIECRVGLNKGKSRHSRQATFARSQGRIDDLSNNAQQKLAMTLHPVTAAIIFWNTISLDKAADHPGMNGQVPDPKIRSLRGGLPWRGSASNLSDRALQDPDGNRTKIGKCRQTGQGEGMEFPCPADRAMSGTEAQAAVAGAWTDDPAGG